HPRRQGHRRPRPDRGDGRELRRLHGRLAPHDRRTFQGGGGALAGDRLVLEHFHSSLVDWVADFVTGTPDAPGGQYHERSPALAGDRLRAPTLLTAGAKDRATPAGQAIEHFRALRTRGVPAAVVVYPEEGHGVQNLPAGIDLGARITAWFERFLPAR